MRVWPLAAFAAVVTLGYLLFFALDSLQGRGANALGLANVVGLVTVAVGLVAAVAILRRTSRP